MPTTIEAMIDEKGNVVLKTPIELPATRRALVVILEEEPTYPIDETAWLHLQSIERGIDSLPAADHSAWEELTAFWDVRQNNALAGQPYRWDRSEIYTEREQRWLRDRDQNKD